MEKSKDKSQEAVDVGSALLIALMENKVEDLTAQAALGNAWYRLCVGFKYPPSVFWEMLNGMGKLYEKEFDEQNKKTTGLG